MSEIQRFLKGSWDTLESKRITLERAEAVRMRAQEAADAEQKRVMEAAEAERIRTLKAAEDAQRRNQAWIERFNEANTAGLVALWTGIIGVCFSPFVLVSLIASFVTICRVIQNWRLGSSRLPLDTGHKAAIWMPIPAVVLSIVFYMMTVGQVARNAYDRQHPALQPATQSIVIRVSSDRFTKVDWPTDHYWNYQTFVSPRPSRILFWRQNTKPDNKRRQDGVMQRHGDDPPGIPESREPLWLKAETDYSKKVVEFDLVVNFAHQ
jgi:hypothetical protein